MCRVVLIFIGCALDIALMAQAPFGTFGTKWTFEAWSEGSGWKPFWQGNCAGSRLTYEVTGQIEINGKTCGIITTNKTTDSIIVYQEAGIVYFYEDSEFYKLFDFNVTIGDTLLTFRPGNAWNHSLKDFFGGYQEEFEDPDTIYTLITGHDTLVVNGVSLKRWTTEPLIFDPFAEEPKRLYETIVENIGSLNGILGDHGWFIGEGCYGGFVCYESDHFQYGSYFFPLCDFVSQVNQTPSVPLRMYPNPTTGHVIIDLEVTNIRSIDVFDLTGIKILSSKTNTLDMSLYPPGCYIVFVRDFSDNMSIGKLMNAN